MGAAPANPRKNSPSSKGRLVSEPYPERQSGSIYQKEAFCISNGVGRRSTAVASPLPAYLAEKARAAAPTLHEKQEQQKRKEEALRRLLQEI
jgi:hypothetical protein